MIRFSKMQGIGNDFIVVDALIESELPDDLASLSRRVNDRRFGVGGDGLVVLDRGATAAFRMRMFNPDGSESEMCGNAVRCVAKLIRERDYSDAEKVYIETGAGRLAFEILSDLTVRVDMGCASLEQGQIPGQFVDQLVGSYRGTAVSMGNPHLVIFVDDVAKVDLPMIGPQLENNKLFPNRTNVHFVQVVDRTNLIQRTWERGAGVTLACGTGACAVAVAAKLTGRVDSPVVIALPGGSLTIEVSDDLHVHMTGPAETVFEGELP